MKFFTGVFFSFYLFLILLPLNQIFPQSPGVKYHAFSGTLVLSVEGASTLELTDYYGAAFDYLGKVSLEYFFPAYSRSSFGLRAFGAQGFISGNDAGLSPDHFRTDLSTAGGGIVYNFSIDDWVFTYLFAGASYLWFNPKGGNGSKLPNNLADRYDNHELNYNGELGFRFLLTDDLSFNINGGVQVSPNDYLDDQPLGTSNDAFLILGAGFSFAFFAEKDVDGDGVFDSKDVCSSTPPGVKVDEFGCPIDKDRDGVPDYLDQCPETPYRVLVDSKGCPFDADGDKVPDYIDVCDNTPEGVSVDELGCPYDLDKDGIPDYQDKCPNTPENVQVDKDGCPADTDLDGVPDYRDDCPETPAGEQVDENGCPPVVEVQEMVLSSGANFAVGSSQLLPSAYPELDKMVKIMGEEKGSRWRIEGHTDASGSAEINKKISKQRAESVLNYFLSKGISRSRFEVVGLGEDYPVADNSTEEGKAKNRRVLIIRID